MAPIFHSLYFWYIVNLNIFTLVKQHFTFWWSKSVIHLVLCHHLIRYPATIEKIDYDKERVLIHYRQWSRRHDEWFQWTSPYLRPLERVSLRRQGLNPPCSQPVWRLCPLWAHMSWFLLLFSVVLLGLRHCSVSGKGVCGRYKGFGLLDRLSFLPSQNHQGQQWRWGLVPPFTQDLKLLYIYLACKM